MKRFMNMFALLVLVFVIANTALYFTLTSFAIGFAFVAEPLREQAELINDIRTLSSSSISDTDMQLIINAGASAQSVRIKLYALLGITLLALASILLLIRYAVSKIYRREEYISTYVFTALFIPLLALCIYLALALVTPYAIPMVTIVILLIGGYCMYLSIIVPKIKINQFLSILLDHPLSSTLTYLCALFGTLILVAITYAMSVFILHAQIIGIILALIIPSIAPAMSVMYAMEAVHK